VNGTEPTSAEPGQVVATAGHVDHGKSSLIVSLTGIDPDRLEEEKRRGLTIDLGFAWRTLPSGREVGFVDVPGHERFVRTMLAGVGPVRLVLFVVAADEGWKPQSEEHLAIVDVLGVDGAVVALTKRDLVDDDRLVGVEADVRSRLEGTALESAPTIACSSRTGAGIEDVVRAIDTMVAAAPPPDASGPPRLFVDRVFTIAGAGTVVTGTLARGTLFVGDELEAHPSGVRARIRSLQRHGRPIEAARAVARVAANLAGTERSRLKRGDVLGRPGERPATAVLEARVTPVRGLGHPLTARGAFTFHAGAAERPATIRPYHVSAVRPEGAFVRIRLSEPLALEVHDRFVLRESGRRETVAGGVVLDAAPPKRPGSDAAARLTRRAAPGADLAALLLEERGAVPVADLRALTGADGIEGMTPVGGWWVSATVRSEGTRAAEERVRASHVADPGAEGIAASSVRAAVGESLRAVRAPSADDLADALVEDLVAGGRLERSGGLLRLPGHRVGIEDEELRKVIGAIEEAEPTPPAIGELVAAGFDRRIVDAAVRSGALVRISPDLVLTRRFVERAIALIQEQGPAGMTVSALRAALGTSRKYAVPLMEHLDRAGLTRRAGDLRFARGT
jgi:selenocysteine-specific elongation factor